MPRNCLTLMGCTWLLTAVAAHAQLAPATTTSLNETVSARPIPPNALDPLLQNRLSNTKGRSRVIVGAFDAAGAANLAAVIRLAGGAPGRTLGIVSAVAADIPNASIPAIASNPIVRRMALDRLTAGAMDRTSAAV